MKLVSGQIKTENTNLSITGKDTGNRLIFHQQNPRQWSRTGDQTRNIVQRVHIVATPAKVRDYAHIKKSSAIAGAPGKKTPNN